LELSEMLVAARANLWKMQDRLGVKPHVNILINDHFGFCLANPSTGGTTPPEPYLKIYIAPAKLRRMLNRDLHFNNLEVSGDVMFDRVPNTYNPDVHTLMSFFHLPRPT